MCWVFSKFEEKNDNLSHLNISPISNYPNTNCKDQCFTEFWSLCKWIVFLKWNKETNEFTTMQCTTVSIDWAPITIYSVHCCKISIVDQIQCLVGKQLIHCLFLAKWKARKQFLFTFSLVIPSLLVLGSPSDIPHPWLLSPLTGQPPLLVLITWP